MGLLHTLGLLSTVRLAPDRPDLEAATSPAPTIGAQFGIRAPWQPESHLNTLVWQDIVGKEAVPLTRAAAMAVPAVARVRHLIAGTIARLPLTAWRAAEQLEPPPPWMHQAGGGLPPYHRMLWTVDDLLFHGWSLWVARRGAEEQLLEAGRVATHRWRFDTQDNGHRVLVDDKPVRDRDVILIPGPHEGLLNFGSQAIRQAADLEANAAKFAANPHAYIELHQTEGADLTDPQIDALIARWAAARHGEHGGVAFTSKQVAARELGAAPEHLLLDGRNFAAVNMARLGSVPATLVDASSVKSTLTYETSQGRNGEFLDYGLSLYLEAIAARLSLDDVVPHGQSVRFDTTELRQLTPTPTGPVTED